jgi:hypothetical protein
LFFCAHFHAQLKASNPQFDFQELSKALGLQANCFMRTCSFASDYISMYNSHMQWRNLTEAEKYVFKQKAEQPQQSHN